MTMTPKKLAALALIARWQLEYGVAPTLDEMAAVLNVSRITVHERIMSLVKDGYLKKQPHQARALRLTQRGRMALPGQRCPTCGRRNDIPNNMEVEIE